MPIPTLPAGCARVAINGGYGGTKFTNIFHFAVVLAGSITTPILEDLANQCADAYASHFMPSMFHTCQLESAYINYLGETTLYSAVVARDNTGSLTGTAAPSSLAGVISWNVAEAYRGGHGRTYLGGLEDGSVLDINHVTGDYVDGLVTGAGAFMDDMNAWTSDDWSATVFGIVRTQRRKALLNPPEFAPITGFRVSNRIRTQRRRLNPA